jgi:putative selenate reductase
MKEGFGTITTARLAGIILDQLERKEGFFGYPKKLFFYPSESDPFRMKRYGRLLETPLGVAAGPHTQLAQNIVTAWLFGARYIELKTVQTLDELQVTKPCIDMRDEGYNCEWSQELKVHESFDQYLNAWILIHLLKDRLGIGRKHAPGTIFNMSVGYSYDGLMQQNMQDFFSRMADCSREKKEKLQELAAIYPRAHYLKIGSRMSGSVTLSTMHGCPPGEIEKIGRYLMEEKRLHLTIKLNPTLLGKKDVSSILGQSGFHITLPDEVFGHDLGYAEAVSVIKNLRDVARQGKLRFGVKLTNTLEVANRGDALPAGEQTVYLSGRALHPVAVALAEMLQKTFDGRLDISFSAGVDAFNLPSVVACGLAPVTVCSGLLKPGGYALLAQHIENLRDAMKKARAETIPDFIDKKKRTPGELRRAALKNLIVYNGKVASDNRYRKDFLDIPYAKSSRDLAPFDCIEAPCVDGCPARQDIPAYLRLAAGGNYDEALRVILDTNPLPVTTGTVCDHPCQVRCTRMFYDTPLRIREMKRYLAAQLRDHTPLLSPGAKRNIRIAVIGGGPSGLSCAHRLACAGIAVDIFNMEEEPGGMVSSVIPAFRLDSSDWKRELATLLVPGISIHGNTRIDRETFLKLRKEYDGIYIATGAGRTVRPAVEGLDGPAVYDPLEFLRDVKTGRKTSMEGPVAVIGGGNTAMDVARTAARLVAGGVTVTIVYRRTISQMPACREEIAAALKENILLDELALPVRFDPAGGMLTCIRMKTGEKGADGRLTVVPIEGAYFSIPARTVIPATGQQPVLDFLGPEEMAFEKGSIIIRDPGIGLGGDALRGGGTVIQAVADGQRAAGLIMERHGLVVRDQYPYRKPSCDLEELQVKRSLRIPVSPGQEKFSGIPGPFGGVPPVLSEQEAVGEASRCLQCDELCNNCVTACPNLANYFYTVQPVKFTLPVLKEKDGRFSPETGTEFEVRQPRQILHLADWCNRCGNCFTFCPTASAPYLCKPHLYLTETGFRRAAAGYYLDGKGVLHGKDAEGRYRLSEKAGSYHYLSPGCKAAIDKDGFSLLEWKTRGQKKDKIYFYRAAEMSIILPAARELYSIRKYS